MRWLLRATIAAIAAAPLCSGAAEQWTTGCQTVTSVQTYLAYNNSIVVGLSPGIPGCNVGATVGGVEFTVGTDGVTSTYINAILATSLSAYASGSQVMVYYDSSCFGVIIAVGGADGTNCP